MDTQLNKQKMRLIEFFCISSKYYLFFALEIAILSIVLPK
jgi:hypothetical protein